MTNTYTNFVEKVKYLSTDIAKIEIKIRKNSEEVSENTVDTFKKDGK